MNELLDQLEERSRWPWVTAAATLVLGLGLGAMTMHGLRPEAEPAPEVEPCAAPEIALEGVWDEHDRERVTAGFLSVGLEDARPMLERTNRVLDDYAHEWTEAYSDSCRATYVTRQQSEARFDAQMQCLRSRRNRLQAAIDTLASAEDTAQLQDRVLAPLRLPSIDDCEELELGEDVWTLPDDPELRQRIETQRKLLDVAQTMRDARDQDRGVELTSDIVEQARRLGFPPLLARALEVRGHLQADTAAAKDAEQTLREAIAVAAQTGQSAVEARAWASLLFTLVKQHELEAGGILLFPAEAAMRRAGDDEALAWLHNSEGTRLAELGEYREAAQHMRRALELKRQTLGTGHVDVGAAWANLGSLHAHNHRPAEAREAFGHARTIFASTVGTEHGFYQLAQFGLCRVELEARRYDEAYRLCRSALDHFERAPSSPFIMGLVHFRTAKVLIGLSREAEAIVLAERARELFATDNPQRAAEITEWIENPSAHPPEDTEPAPEPGRSRGK